MRGRKLTTTDPDLGTWAYTYNGFSELVAQVDAKTQTTTMTYDQLGRMLTKTELVGTPQASTAEWVYDVADGAGIGKLAVEVSAADPRLIGDCGSPHVPGTAPFGRSVTRRSGTS